MGPTVQEGIKRRTGHSSATPKPSHSLSNKLSNLNGLYIESGTHNNKEYFFAEGFPTTREKFGVCALWELSPTLQESVQGESVDVSVDQGYQTGR